MVRINSESYEEFREEQHPQLVNFYDGNLVGTHQLLCERHPFLFLFFFII